MKTTHRIRFENAVHMADMASEGVDLVITSPPYPMIDMWDPVFIAQNPAISQALADHDGLGAFERMHQLLDPIWGELHRVLKPGGMACINIGDATRSINGHFALYPNHSRIISRMLALGLTPLPAILWRKQTNAPNKFMGSGMLPAGAYVTLEHEFILIFRKGGKRIFTSEEKKAKRRESALFWEERNHWFSDIWTDLKGRSQNLFADKTRNRSGAFPFELPYRLIHMFSVKEDTVLDPFLGIGTTSLAAMAAGRNSLGYEWESGFKTLIFSAVERIVDHANQRIEQRLKDHLAFVQERAKSKQIKHINANYGFPVVSKQEKELLLNPLISVDTRDRNTIEVGYSDRPQAAFYRHPD